MYKFKKMEKKKGQMQESLFKKLSFTKMPNCTVS